MVESEISLTEAIPRLLYMLQWKSQQTTILIPFRMLKHHRQNITCKLLITVQSHP